MLWLRLWYGEGMNLFWWIVVLVVISLLYLRWRTYGVEHSASQSIFAQGEADLVGFNGEYRGSASGYLGSWQGKTIDEAGQRGINRFTQNGGVVNKYPFTTYIGKGLRDTDQDVMKLDYNQPGNPWWLKFIVDEVVKVGEGEYLGKVHVRLGPAVSTLMWFRLTK